MIIRCLEIIGYILYIFHRLELIRVKPCHAFHFETGAKDGARILRLLKLSELKIRDND